MRSKRPRIIMYRAALYMFWYSRGIDGKSRDRDAASIIREADSVAL